MLYKKCFDTEVSYKYVYRYLTFEKLTDFLESESIYLSRLDSFEDNLENIEPYDINELKTLTLSKPVNPNIEINETEWEEIIADSKKKLKNIQKKIIENQKKQFVSCWFLSDVESFGMWETYGKSGFVIRFKKKCFDDVIKNSTLIQSDLTKKIDLLILGNVIYQNFNEMIQNEENSKLEFSSLRKHLSFAHEAEYRIIGFTENIDGKLGLRFKLRDFNNLDFEIFANPKFSNFQFKQYKRVLKKYSNHKILKESELKMFLDFRNLDY